MGAHITLQFAGAACDSIIPTALPLPQPESGSEITCYTCDMEHCN